MAKNLSLLPSSALPNFQHKDEIHWDYTRTLEKTRLLFNEEVDDRLSLIDTIQRLALDHHFSFEIGATLQKLYESFSEEGKHIYNDLYEVSISFLLLRQAGFPITQDVFKCFMNQDGKFNNIHIEDTKGLLALFEASQLGFEGEDILDEAASFSIPIIRDNLECKVFDDQQAKMMKITLQNPRQRTMVRIVAKNFVEHFECTNKWETVLRGLARLEDVVIGSLFQEEMHQVVKWWNGVGLARELEGARNQPTKWHMWSMGVLLDPTLSLQRILLTKLISLVYIVDDIFDIYGTIDQLILFTQFVNRWEICENDEVVLPEYMKMCCIAIQETTQEISRFVLQNHGFNPFQTLKASWGKLMDAFFMEAKWFSNGHLPKPHHYLQNGIVSSGVLMVLSHLYFIIGDAISDQGIFQLTDSESVPYLVAMILRLLDDMGSAQDEEQDGYDGSYVDCYMKEFGISSRKVANEHVMKTVSNAWKKLNRHCISSSNVFPLSFTKACLNAARMVPIMYNYEDDHALPILQECITSMLNV